MSTKQDLLDIGLNAFGLELFIESFLRSKMANVVYKKGVPASFTFPINRSDCPSWEGVQVTLMPISKNDSHADEGKAGL